MMANTPISAHGNPMMLGVNAHAHIPPPHNAQATTATTFPSVPNVQASAWSSPEPYTLVPVKGTPCDNNNESHHHHVKRLRDSQQQQQQEESYAVVHQHTATDVSVASPSSGKKQRPSNYCPPRNVDKKSVLAATGSLVGGGEWGQSTTMVRMRRELSGGQLDQFFRSHDEEMEQDHDHRNMRPRSMSF